MWLVKIDCRWIFSKFCTCMGWLPRPLCTIYHEWLEWSVFIRFEFCFVFISSCVLCCYQVCICHKFAFIVHISSNKCTYTHVHINYKMIGPTVCIILQNDICFLFFSDFVLARVTGLPRSIEAAQSENILARGMVLSYPCVHSFTLTSASSVVFNSSQF